MIGIGSFAASVRGQALLHRLTDERETLLQLAIAIQQIPAPTFDERRRADFVIRRFQALGLDDCAIDSLHNVYGRLPGCDSSLPALMISAHTDTVFPEETSLTSVRDPERLYGPSIGDNSMGVAALLHLAGLMVDPSGDFRRASDVWFVANTREEGLGDLGGMRAAVDRLRDRLGMCIVLEGMAYGQVYSAGIAVRRLKIAASGAGGHSWLHFGQPSAIHALVRFAAKLTDLTVPTAPRTSYNIGLIEGGQSVNSIATDASLTLDMRSEDPAALAALEARVMDALQSSQMTGIEFATTVVGDRPAGRIPNDHALVRAAAEALGATGTTPNYHTGSTDANYPLALGIPAVTVGITTGGNAHRLDEFIDLAPIPRGMFHLALLALAASNGKT